MGGTVPANAGAAPVRTRREGVVKPVARRGGLGQRLDCTLRPHPQGAASSPASLRHAGTAGRKAGRIPPALRRAVAGGTAALPVSAAGPSGPVPYQACRGTMTQKLSETPEQDKLPCLPCVPACGGDVVGPADFPRPLGSAAIRYLPPPSGPFPPPASPPLDPRHRPPPLAEPNSRPLCAREYCNRLPYTRRQMKKYKLL